MFVLHREKWFAAKFLLSNIFCWNLCYFLLRQQNGKFSAVTIWIRWNVDNKFCWVGKIFVMTIKFLLSIYFFCCGNKRDLLEFHSTRSIQLVMTKIGSFKINSFCFVVLPGHNLTLTSFLWFSKALFMKNTTFLK